MGSPTTQTSVPPALLSTILMIISACNGGGTSGPQDVPQPLPSATSLRLQTVTTSLSSPLFVTAPSSDATRLFIVEQGGTIKIFDIVAGSLRSTPFLNLSSLVESGGEEGLLGLAFDPAYNINRRLYVYYTDTNSNLVIARYLRDVNDSDLADPSSASILLTISHPGQANHNGGMLAFGPDGCLYAGSGDGGGEGDPNNNAQNLSQLLGKLLRLDPSNGSACTLGGSTNPFNSLIWNLGLRNPWRFSFDRVTGDLYIADVGQGTREEVNVSPAPMAGRGLNYGWRLMEGFLCFNPSMACDTGGLTLPVLDYPHAGGACAITGGYVYRGSAIPSLQGTYFYADFCAGFVRSFRFTNGQPTEQAEWSLLSPPGSLITSFGEDAQGELYLTTQGGALWKIVQN
jgi:glucose/arabinose dehydrogenase